MKDKLKKVIKRVESTLSVRVKAAIGLVVLGLLGFSAYSAHKLLPTSEAQNTVMITNLEQNSGGTGVVVSSSEDSSSVLTNNHVCEVIKTGGGLVISDEGQHTITSLQQSKEHDLCLVQVRGNLHAKVKVAAKAPQNLSEALISGHPRLLPTVQTKGHYTGRTIIPIMVGITSCQAGDQDPYCQMFGSKPVLRYMESVIVTATIMPGSSGSGVYNAEHELTNLVFAGHSGDGLSYAFVVPYEYLSNFLNNEVTSLEVKVPSYKSSDLGPQQEAQKQFPENLQHIKEVCSTTIITDPTAKEICKAANSSVLGIDL